jgi:hypothetical protein
MLPVARLVEIQGEITESAARRGLRLKLLGGLGIALASPSTDPTLERSFGDLDFLAAKGASRAVEELFRELGYEADPASLQSAHRRQIWWPPGGGTHVDVFLGAFEMCHTLDLSERLGGEPPTLFAADLLLSKLQIVELNEKDAIDTCRLLAAHALGPDDALGEINLPYVCGLLAADWGFFTTVTDNLAALADSPVLAGAAEREAIEQRRRALLAALEAEPKTRGFRLRARVGRKKRWYRLPEEIEGEDCE